MSVLTSAQSSETLVHEGTNNQGADSAFALLSYPITSHSQLTLVNRGPARDRRRPQGLVLDTVTVSQVQDVRPLSELSPLILDILNSCPVSECLHQLGGVLQQLSLADISTLLHELDVAVSKRLLLIDGLVQSGRGSGVLSGWISPDEEEEVVKRILLHLATGRIPPNK